MMAKHVIGGRRHDSNTKSAVELSPRLIMAVLAGGMIVGALLTSPTKPTGPAADLARAATPAAQSGGSQ